MELSEEEKKAIEDSKELINDLEKRKDKDFIGRLYYKNRPIEDTLMLLLNITERCQEEIEELKKDRKDNIQVVYGGRRFGTEGMVVKDYISKDKIREKIKQYQDVKKEIIKNENKLSRPSITYDIVRNDYCEKMLRELLEEN